MPTRAKSAVPPVVVETDLNAGILRVGFSGNVTPEDVAARFPSIQEMVPKLGTGFTLVTDLSGLESMDLDCGTYISRLMDLCLAAGIRKVVRIIPDPRKDIGFNLLGVLHYRGRVPAVTCKTREEAQLELARNGRD